MKLNTLLQQSRTLEDALHELFGAELFDDSDRISITLSMCDISFEHAKSMKILIEAKNYISAISLARLQLEAQVRAMWLIQVASDEVILSFSEPISKESEEKSKRLPILGPMLKSLDNKLHNAAIVMLNDFKDSFWAALNSFVHSGTHAVALKQSDCPEPLIINLIKNSNAILTMTAMLLAQLSGEKLLIDLVSKKLKVPFKECLPDLH